MASPIGDLVIDHIILSRICCGHHRCYRGAKRGEGCYTDRTLDGRWGFAAHYSSSRWSADSSVDLARRIGSRLFSRRERRDFAEGCHFFQLELLQRWWTSSETLSISRKRLGSSAKSNALHEQGNRQAHR